jgi:hypothetical protein
VAHIDVHAIGKSRQMSSCHAKDISSVFGEGSSGNRTRYYSCQIEDTYAGQRSLAFMQPLWFAPRDPRNFD